MSTEPARTMECERCGHPMHDDAVFCENCGAAVSTPVQDEKGDRDHFTLAPASWVAGVCDRGQVDRGNEDAMALAATEPAGSHAALVVCDGVTSAPDSDVASLAAARAALAILAAPFSKGLGGEDSAVVAAGRTFERAVREAQTAVLRESERNSVRAGACTFAAAVVSGDVVWTAGIGDSRVYLVPDDGKPLMLTTDDSMAELLISSGVPRADAEDTPIAHTITRWLGVDAPDLDPHARRFELSGPGWLIVCSDGLWNYASAEQDVAAVLAEVQETVSSSEPLALAEGLVRWANEQGGSDNVTVALARVG
ncbi:protein phosphatase 2C domain-containing protein [Granulicoccus sp. GXG6511]|uniref:protein phosphatase 2C domain-containing protein n=1 Tax=Granulicoccus sp. GXG6511 TaxID=3381351 RepID=UPI003D7ED81C